MDIVPRANHLRCNRLAFVLAVAVLWAIPRPAVATTDIYEWLGFTNGNMSGTLANYWNSTTNATPTQAPNGSDPDIIEFNSPGYYNNLPVMNSPLTLGGLWFSNSDTSGITIGGSSTLTLDGTTVNGNITTGILLGIGSGPVTINAPLALGANQSWYNTSTSSLTIGGTLSMGSNTLTILGSSYGSVNFSGAITGGSNSVLDIGNGTGSLIGPVTLSGANTGFAGTVTLNAEGVLLNIENANALGTGTLSFTNQSAANIAIDSPSQSLVLGNSVKMGGSFAFIGTNNLTLGGLAIGGNFSIVANNSVLTFAGTVTNTNTGTGATTLSATGFDGGITAGSVVLNNLPLTNTSAQTGFALSGTTNFTVTGAVTNGTAMSPGFTYTGTTATSTAFLAGANMYSGTTIISGGILSTGPGGTLANGGSPSSVGKSSNIAANLVLSGGTLQYASTGAAASTDRLLTLSASSTIDASGTNSITFAGNGTGANNAIAFGTSGTNYGLTLTGSGVGVFDPIIGSNGATVALAKSGLGSWTLGNAEGYTGATTINAGTLTLADGATLASTTLTLEGGTLADGNGGTQTFATVLRLGGSGVGATNGSTLKLGALTRSANETLAFTFTAGTTINVGSTAVASGILGGWAVANGLNWATTTGGNIVAYGNSGIYYGGTLPSAATSATTMNYILAGAQTQSGTGATVSVNALNITDNTSSGDTLALGSNNLTFTNTNGGLLYSGSGTYSISGTGYLGAGTSSEFIVTVGSGTLTIGAPLIGSAASGTLTKAGAGTLVLSNGTSNYTGTTYVNSGTLQLGVSSTTTGGATLALSTGPTGAGPLFVNGSGVLDLDGNNLAVSGMGSYGAGTGGTIANSSTSASGTLTIVTSGSSNYYGAIADAIGSGTQKTSVLIAGGGTQTMSGQSTYSGGTTLNSGTLAIGTSSLLNSGGTFVSGPLGTGTLTVNGGTLQLNGTTSNANSVIVLANNIVLNGTMTLGSQNTNNPNDLAGQISGTGGITTASGMPYVSISNPNNTFTGPVTVTNGSFQVTADGALPSGVNLTVGPASSDTSAVVYFEESNGVQTIGGLSGYGSLSFTGSSPTVAGTFTLLLGAGNATSTFNGGIKNGSGAGFEVTKIGTGTLTLTGASTFTGRMTIDAGTLALDASSTTVALSSSASLLLAGGNLADSGSSTAAESFSSTQVFAGGSGIANSSGHAVALNAISRFVGGTVNFSATNTSGTGVGAVTTTNTTTATNGILGGWAVFQGASWATSNGATSPYYISGYMAGTSISGSGNLASGTANYVITGNETDAEASPIANAIEFGNTATPTSLALTGGLVITSGGILVPNTVASATSITGGTIEGTAGNTAANDLIVNQYSANSLTIGSVIANNGNNGSTTNALTIAGTGTTILTGANTYTGGTFINSGTLQIGAGGTSGSVGTGPVANNGILVFDRSDTSPGLAVSAPISGSGSVQQIGAGSTTLSGANTYTGVTTVAAGTLRVTNTNGFATGATGLVTVSSGATLAGGGGAMPGFIGGTVSILAGGTIAPAGAGAATSSSIGTLTVGGLNLANGATSASQLNYLYNISATPALDQIAVSNILTLPSGTAADEIQFNFFAPGGVSPLQLPVSNTPYVLITYGSLSGSSNLASLSVNAADLNGAAATFSTIDVDSVNMLEVKISAVNGSATWASNSGGSNPMDFGTAANWAPTTVPTGVGLVATFGTGSETTVSINGGYTVGQLNFNNGGNTGSPLSYNLSGNGSLTLNNSGNSGGASVNVSSGGLNSTLQSSLTLTLADSSLTTTFNIATGSSLDLRGAINESPPMSGQQIVLTGGGTLQLDAGASFYTGGTTINSGTLILHPPTGTATLGTGPLAINGSTSIVDANPVSNALTVGSLSGTGGGQLNVASLTTLTVNQSTSGTLAGTLSLGISGGLVLQQASGNTLTISGASSLAGGNSIAVNSGTLALTNNTGNPASIAGAATVSVAPGATLQLAGTSAVLSSAVNITTQGSGTSGDGALTVVGTTTQTVGVISGNTLGGSVTTYAGNTTVGDGTNAANLTATQILQNKLTINAGSTVTIAPSGPGIETDAQGSGTVSGVALAAGSSDSSNDSADDPFTAIQAAIASGSISSVKGEQLENRIAAIERLAATDPGLDVSLLEDRVLAALPATAAWSSSGTESSSGPLVETGSGLLAVDSSTIGSTSGSTLGGATAAFAPAADFGGNPAAVPEPPGSLLAVLGGIGVLIAIRRRNHARTSLK